MINGHGDDAYRYTAIHANFSSNVYHRVNHDGLNRYLAGCLPCIRSYPEPEPYALAAELARLHGVSPEEVCVTNGATEAIYLIAQAFCGSHSAVWIPTFSEYADACRLHGHRVEGISSLEKLTGNEGIFWLCNPNNPTGQTWDAATLRRLIATYPRKLFVIDQSYALFTEKKVLSVAETVKLPNVLLLHSMTKCYAVPGLRLGAVTGSRELLSRIRACRMPWSVNALAVEAGHYLLQHPEEYRMDIQALLTERKRVTDALEASGGVEVLPTDTHYFLARLQQGTAAQLKEFLATRHGLLIRDASNFEGLDARYFRIAIQTEEENNLLIEGIHEWIQNS